MESTDPELDRIRMLKMMQMRSDIGQKETKIKVQVYSTNSCPYCHLAKQYLKQKNVEFEEIDVASDPKSAQFMFSSTGQMGVPQINIGGNWVIGFDRAKIDALLSLD
jgi:glutaredoxin-like YruB-family protein